jgi:hypothetical protein
LRLAFLRAFRLVTRVAALLVEDEELPCFFGEIFFSAIQFTPFGVPAQPIGRQECPSQGAIRSVSGVTGIAVTFVTRDQVTNVTPRL